MYKFHSIVYHLFLYFPEIGDERRENELGILLGFQSITCGFQGSNQWWTRNSQEIFCRLERREDWTDQEIAFFFSSSLLSDLMTEKRASGFLSRNTVHTFPETRNLPLLPLLLVWSFDAQGCCKNEILRISMSCT